MFEYRSPNYDDGTTTWSSSQSGGTWRVPSPPAGGYKRAGYDINAAGTGLLRWYVGTETDQSLSSDFVGIRPGTDGSLQSVVAGDDVLEGGKIFWGANGILNSTVAGDDGLLHDVRLFPASDPRDLADRKNVDFWPADQSFPGPLRWRDGTDSRLEVRQVTTENDTGGASHDSVLIEFGKGFRPFLRPPATPLRAMAGPGGSLNKFTVAGTYGTSRFYGWLVGNDRSYLAGPDGPVVDDELRTFYLSPEIPPGNYRLVLGLPGGPTGRVSNSAEIEVKNPLYQWRQSMGVPSTTRYESDADLDGRSLLLEAVQGTNPLLNDRPSFGGGVTIRRVVVPRLFPLEPLVYREITWRYRVFECVRVRCQTSTDLVAWTTATPAAAPVLDGSGGATQTAILDGDSPTLFARMVVDLVLP